jgi:hypothetical protein
VSVVAVVVRVVRAFKVESDQFQVVDRASLSGELKSLAVVSDGNALDKIQHWAEMVEQGIPIIRITEQLEITHLEA